MRKTNFLESLGQDLRYAARILAKSPGFTLVMVATLALSIGATSAIVSVFNGVLLRPLPYRHPDQLVRIFTSNQAWPKFPINRNDFLDFRARLRSFESMAAYTRGDLQLSGTGEAVRLSGFLVTGGFFHVLGLTPELGREFNRSDELPGKGNVAIVSDKIWRTRLAPAGTQSDKRSSSMQFHSPSSVSCRRACSIPAICITRLPTAIRWTSGCRSSFLIRTIVDRIF